MKFSRCRASEDITPPIEEITAVMTVWCEADDGKMGSTGLVVCVSTEGCPATSSDLEKRAASAARRATRPGTTLPPALIHKAISAGTALNWPVFTARRTDDLPNAASPML